MNKIDLKRNDICLCSSGKKFKNCCLGKYTFSSVTDLDFILTKEYITSVPEKLQTIGFKYKVDLILQLLKHCNIYAKSVLKDIDSNKAYMYIFKENLNNNELYICNIKEVDVKMNVDTEEFAEQAQAANIMISTLQELIKKE